MNGTKEPASGQRLHKTPPPPRSHCLLHVAWTGDHSSSAPEHACPLECKLRLTEQRRSNSAALARPVAVARSRRESGKLPRCRNIISPLGRAPSAPPPLLALLHAQSRLGRCSIFVNMVGQLGIFSCTPGLKCL